jgi:hypothetical protein
MAEAVPQPAGHQTDGAGRELSEPRRLRLDWEHGGRSQAALPAGHGQPFRQGGWREPISTFSIQYSTKPNRAVSRRMKNLTTTTNPER